MNPSKILSVLVWFCLFLSPGVVFAEAVQKSDGASRYRVAFSKLDFETRRGDTRSVVRGATSGASRKKGQWGIIRAEYMSEAPWTDELEFRFSVLFFDEDKPVRDVMQRFTCFQDSVVYLNVPAGRSRIAEIFIHPHVLGRFGELKELRVEMWRGGQMEDEILESFSSKKERRFLGEWWTRFQPRGGMLRNRHFTPFVHDGDTAEELIKLG
jgi:hypothetical protein